MSAQTSPQTRKDIEARIIARAWKDENYRQELLDNPKSVFEREFEIKFSSHTNIEVLEENSNNLYFVIPISPNLSEAELSGEELEAIAGGSIFGGLGNAFGTIYDKGKDLGDTIYDATN